MSHNTPNADEMLAAVQSLAGDRVVLAYEVAKDGVWATVSATQKLFFGEMQVRAELARLAGQAYLAQRTAADVSADTIMIEVGKGNVRTKLTK